MFKASQRKIILSIMLSVLTLFILTIGVILYFSVREIREKNQEMLDRYVEMYSLDQNVNEAENTDLEQKESGSAKEEKEAFSHKESVAERKSHPILDQPGGEFSTFYGVAIDSEENVLSISHEGKAMFSDAELRKMAKEVLKNGKASGKLGSLSYLVSERESYTLVAFMDNQVSEGGLRNLLRYILLIGGMALLFLFALSLYLSGQIIKPLKENDEKQKRFISDAGHELKTPIAVIATNAELLSREIGEKEWLSNILYENRRMGDLVKQLLTLSRVENAEVSMEEVNLSRIVTGESLAMESIAFEKGKILQTEIEENIRMMGNVSQLTQLCSILLDNAISYSSGEKIDLQLMREGQEIVFFVENEGEAIPEEKQTALFDRFYRMDEARNADGKHYGLGLSIAKAVAEKHKGRISVSCKEGKVRFSVFFL
nr:HAMP domain-containing sensor histidine kinase [uncultured Oribacterium sp.]